MYKIVGIATVLFLVGSFVEGKSLKTPPFIFEKERPLESFSVRADDDFINYRLPNETIPIHYDIEITSRVDLGKTEFQGVVTIEIEVVENTNSITLHAAKETVINKISFPDFPAVTATNTRDELREFLIITPTEPILTKGAKLNLKIEYSSNLRVDDYSGFYQGSYVGSDGEVHYLATTQFESVDARHAFPCYDEPAKRATFKFSFVHGEKYNAICDTAVESGPTPITGTDTVRTVFKTTYPMSTYITAFIISDFEYTEAVLRGLKQRVYSRPNTKEHQEFALMSAVQLIAALDDYFGIKYETMLPEAKLDQVALPQFSAGAMENWGLTTYREEYLLYEDGHSTVQTQTNIANILGHEDVHQWFGDYVAVEWWTYLWLKESFAQYYSYVSNDLVYPEWDIYQLYTVAEYQRGMAADSGSNPRPMTHYVNTPREIGQLYDSISYAKGSAVLRMFSNAVTEEVFKTGLNKYLTANKFSSAVEQRLFEMMDTAAQDHNLILAAPFNESMASWTRQGGHPLITVTRNYDDGSFKIEQTQYFDDETNSNDKTFYVPFNYATKSKPDQSNTTASDWLANVKSKVVEEKIEKDDWLLLNKQSTGFYNINYDHQNWKLLIQALKEKHYKINVHSRAALLYDASKLALTARLDHDILMDLLTYLENEQDYAPWSTASGILTNFEFYLRSETVAYADLKFLLHQVSARIFDKLGVSDIPNERHFDRYLRSVIINLACLGGNKDCLEAVEEKLNDFVDKNVPVEANLKSTVFCNGLRTNNKNAFDKVKKMLTDSTDAAERSIVIQSLGCAQDKTLQDEFVRMSLDGTLEKATEKSIVLRYSYSKGNVGLKSSIDFLSANFKEYSELPDSFGAQNPLEYDLLMMPQYILDKETEDLYNELVKKVRADAEVSAKVRQSLESTAEASIGRNGEWKSKNTEQVTKWLVNYTRGGAGQMAASALTIVCAFFASKYLL